MQCSCASCMQRVSKGNFTQFAGGGGISEPLAHLDLCFTLNFYRIPKNLLQHAQCGHCVHIVTF